MVLEIGKPVPEFKLVDTSGKPFKLADFKGKVVFLNFWASWCEPCKEEMPSMEVLYRTLKNQDFVMLAVNVERWRGERKMNSFVDTMDISFTIAHDSWGKVDRAYKLTGVPETYILDKNGILVEKVLGPRNWTLEENVKTILRLIDEPASGSSPATGIG